MSIQLYSRQLTNGNTGTAAAVVFGEYVASIGALNEDGKVFKKDTKFAMSGVGTVANLDFAAIKMAEKIAKLSDGILLGFHKKLGKYRNDEVPGTIRANKKRWAAYIGSNNPRVEDPRSVVTLPRTAKTAKVFIPWLGETTSDQDVVATLKAPIDGFVLASSRFTDADKIEIEAFPMDYNAGITVKAYAKAPVFDLVNNDVSSGGVDHVMSEAFATVIEGLDDQEPVIN